jgi:hypothetical protein
MAMDLVQPEGLSPQALASLGAACDCMCSENQHAGANGAGNNSNSCGCYCAGGTANNNGNRGGARNSLTGVIEVLQRIEAALTRSGR